MKRKQLLREQLHLNELPLNTEIPWSPEEARAVRQELENSDRALLDKYPPDLMATRIQRRLEQSAGPESRKPWFWTWPALAAAALLVALLPWQSLYPSGPERIKGLGTQLLIFRQTAAEPQQLRDAAKVQAGDKLQIGYFNEGPAYGVIFSVDGSGTVTTHFPEKSASAGDLARGKILLPYSYELDTAPAFERFFFITSSRPFALSDLWKRLTDTGDLKSPEPEWKVQTLTLVKEPRP